MPPASARIVEMRRCAEALQQRAARLLQDQRGFGQGIGDQAARRHDASEAIRRNGPAVSAVHMGPDNIAVMVTPFDMAATARDGGVFDFENGGSLPRPLRLKHDGFGLLTADTQIAAGIDAFLCYSVALQSFDGAVDGIDL